VNELKQLIKLQINGESYEAAVEPWRTLLEVIRDTIALTGTKRGCDEGDCGACTVLMNGRAVNACLILAVEAQDKEITTIEGLADGDKLHPIQAAFVAHGGLQCGFCTPGMILSAKAFLEKKSRPTEEEIKFAIAGNLCRCTGYVKIIESIQAAAKTLRAH